MAKHHVLGLRGLNIVFVVYMEMCFFFLLFFIARTVGISSSGACFFTGCCVCCNGVLVVFSVSYCSFTCTVSHAKLTVHNKLVQADDKATIGEDLHGYLRVFV